MKEKITRLVKEFTKGMLNGDKPNQRCFMVCSALAGYLQFAGYECELTEGDVGEWQHYWITLPDKTIIDPTASQFKKPDKSPMPSLYIGEKPEWYKVAPHPQEKR